MRKIILLEIIIMIQFVSCNKRETNAISLFIKNKTTDTIYIQFYPIPEDLYKNSIVKDFAPDSSRFLIGNRLVGTPNELVKKEFTKMKLILPDTSYIISGKTDTTNNLFINNRWVFMGKNSYVVNTMFSARNVNEYKFVFNIY